MINGVNWVRRAHLGNRGRKCLLFLDPELRQTGGSARGANPGSVRQTQSPWATETAPPLKTKHGAALQAMDDTGADSNCKKLLPDSTEGYRKDPQKADNHLDL